MEGEEGFVLEVTHPKKGDVLFESDSSLWQMDAILDHRSGDGYPYRQGYRRAGRILTEWIAANRHEVDFLVYPICHAYRHFVELTLKRLISVGSSLARRELNAKESSLLNGSHNLQELWKAFKTIAGEVETETGIDPPPQEHIAGIEDYINQLHYVDAGSFTFRYPLTKKGDISVGDLKRINLARFSEHMENLCNYLEGYDIYYGELVDFRHEMLSEYSPDYY
jgi:hypothetical protein